MSLESAITFFIAIFIFGITPGPGVFAILARAMTAGPKQCLLLLIGMIVSDVLYLILACLGLAAIAENWSLLFMAIRYIGASYLLYLGYNMFTLSVSVDAESEQRIDPPRINNMGAMASFIQGFLISISNPKVILFYISFLPSFIDLSQLDKTDIALVSVLSSLALFSGLMLIAVGASKMAGLLKTPSAHQKLNRISGGIMMIAGLYLVVS